MDCKKWTDVVTSRIQDILKSKSSDLREISYSISVLKLLKRNKIMEKTISSLDGKRLCQHIETRSLPLDVEDTYAYLPLDFQINCKVITSAVLEESAEPIKNFRTLYYFLDGLEITGIKIDSKRKISADSMISKIKEPTEIAYAMAVYSKYWHNAIPDSLKEQLKTLAFKFTTSGAFKNTPIFSLPNERHLTWILLDALYRTETTTSLFQSIQEEQDYMRHMFIFGMGDITPKSLYFFISARNIISKFKKFPILSPIVTTSTRSVVDLSSSIKIFIEFLEEIPTIKITPTKISCNQLESTLTLKPLKYDSTDGSYILKHSEIHQHTSGPAFCSVKLEIQATDASTPTLFTHEITYSLLHAVKFEDCSITYFTPSQGESTSLHLTFPQSMMKEDYKSLSMMGKIEILAKFSVLHTKIEKYQLLLIITPVSAVHSLFSSTLIGSCKPAKSQKKKESECLVTIEAKQLIEELVPHASIGQLNLSLKLTAPSVINYQSWHLGGVKSTLDISYPEHSNNDVVKTWVVEMKKSFIHVFPKAPKQPKFIFSFIFTALLAVLIFALIFTWFILDIPIFQVIIPEFVKSPFSILFFSGFFAILILYMKFWISGNMFSTLKVLVPLFCFTSFAGNRMMAYKKEVNN